MIVHHLVQSVQQCLWNDGISLRQKHTSMYHVDLENEYEITFFGTVLTCQYYSIIFTIAKAEHAENQDHICK